LLAKNASRKGVTQMSVESWIFDQLNPEGDDDLDQVIKVTVRLMHDEVAELDDVARRLGISRTACATGLLREAVTEASHFFRDPEAGDRMADMASERAYSEAIASAPISEAAKVNW
jgi:chemotaxis methyl-accepting protein methylase